MQNCSSRLLITGEAEIKSSKGTKQGNPVTMPVYTLSVITDMPVLLEITNTKTNSDTRMVAYTDDFSAAGSSSSWKYWWNTLCEFGPKFGYFPEPTTKSWMIAKSGCSDKAIRLFKDTKTQIITQGKR